MDSGRARLPHETPDVQVSAGALLRRLLAQSLVPPEDLENLAAPNRDYVTASPDADALLDRLQQHQLLTSYQVGRVRSGKANGLILGNYRVLDRLGAGGMGVIYGRARPPAPPGRRQAALASGFDQDRAC